MSQPKRSSPGKSTASPAARRGKLNIAPAADTKPVEDDDEEDDGASMDEEEKLHDDKREELGVQAMAPHVNTNMVNHQMPTYYYGQQIGSNGLPSSPVLADAAVPHDQNSNGSSGNLYQASYLHFQPYILYPHGLPTGSTGAVSSPESRDEVNGGSSLNLHPINPFTYNSHSHVAASTSAVPNHVAGGMVGAAMPGQSQVGVISAAAGDMHNSSSGMFSTGMYYPFGSSSGHWMSNSSNDMMIRRANSSSMDLIAHNEVKPVVVKQEELKSVAVSRSEERKGKTITEKKTRAAAGKRSTTAANKTAKSKQMRNDSKDAMESIKIKEGNVHEEAAKSQMNQSKTARTAAGVQEDLVDMH